MDQRRWLIGVCVGIVAGLVTGCSTGEEATGLARLQLEVAEEPEATPSEHIAILFRTSAPQYGPRPVAADVTEEVGAMFQVVLDPAGPPPEYVQPIVFDEPDSPRGAVGRFYQVVPGMIESSPDGVGAYDDDKVVGHVMGAALVYMPEAGEFADRILHRETVGVTSAGWHLYMNNQEVPLDTPLVMGTEISD